MNYIKNFFLKNKLRTIITIIIIVIGGFFLWRTFGNKSSQPQYQTANVTRGTLVSSAAESGQVAVANRVSITTQASGVVKNIYVKNGDTVTAGQKIADITLDAAGQQRQAQTWAAYLNAKSSVDTANAQMFSLQSAMYSAWQKYTNLATNSTYQNGDGTPNISNRTLPDFTTVQDNWLAAEAQFKNQQGALAQAQAALSSNWLAYQQAASTIYAPSAGTVNDLIIAPGMQIGSANTTAGSSSTGGTSQVVGTVTTEGNPIISVSLSEIDAVKVKVGDKATVTFDALPNKTFTGKILGVNTTGTVSSGVTTYPATIVLDAPNTDILPNMSATANVIISVKQNVLLVPTAAIQTTGGQTIVRVLQNGKVTSVPVTTGDTSDTDTEIVSGLNEGDTVVTGIISSGNQSSGATSSPFGGGFRGFGGGGGAIFRGGGKGRGG